MFSTESETITKHQWLIKFFETPKHLQLNSIALKNCHHFDVQLLASLCFWLRNDDTEAVELCARHLIIWIWIHAEIESWVIVDCFTFQSFFFVVWSQRFPIFVNSLFGIFGEKPLLSLISVDFMSHLRSWQLDFGTSGKVSGLWIWGCKVAWEWWKDNRS